MAIAPIFAAFAAAGFWIISGTLSKKVTLSLGNALSAAIVVTLGIVPMAIGSELVGTTALSAYSELLAVLSGVFLTLGFIMMYKSLQTEQLSNSTALNELQPAILVLLGLFALGEHTSMLQAICIAFIFIGAFLIITTERLTINRKLIPACIAALSWAVYWIMLTYSEGASGGAFALPVTISRISGAVVAIAYLLANRKTAIAYARGALFGAAKTRAYIVALLVSIIAIVDASGDFVFSYVVGSNAVAIGGALTALAPMAVSLMGFILYKERITARQAAGLVIMVAGALAIAIL